MAMNYVSTGDGKIFMFGNARGWDQTEHKPWDWGNNCDQFLHRIKSGIGRFELRETPQDRRGDKAARSLQRGQMEE
jgi:hypothetical protein